MSGKAVTVTLSPYIFEQLDNLEKNMGIKKSAVVAIAIEKYAREIEKQREGENREKGKK